MGTEHDFRIVFEEDGYPRELINSADRERAVREETLTPDMEVTVYRAGAPPGVFRARDIEELKPLFGLDQPVATPPDEPASPAPAPSPPPARPSRPAAPIKASVAYPPGKRDGFWSRDSIGDPAPGAVAGRAAATGRPSASTMAEPAGEEGPAPAPPSPDPGKFTGLWVLLGVMAVLLLIATCSTRTPKVDSGAPVAPAGDALPANDVSVVGPVEETGPAEVTSEEMANSETRYAVRETNVRQRPTSASPTVGKLDRGAAVTGVAVPGIDPEHRWFKITSGEFAGYFVSADANVSGMARPPLDSSFAGGHLVYRSSPLYAEPDRASRILDYAKPGTTLTVVGGVADGLAEVSLRSGAIAYVELGAFEAAADRQEDFNEPAAVLSKDPASSPRVVDLSRPAALQNRDFISASDYPAKSLRENDTGTVGFRVEVSAQGFPGKCRVIRSSGHDRLDRATCKLVEERARFDPARDVGGEPMSGLYEGGFTWRLD
jgi:TonB family protein